MKKIVLLSFLFTTESLGKEIVKIENKLETKITEYALPAEIDAEKPIKILWYPEKIKFYDDQVAYRSIKGKIIYIKYKDLTAKMLSWLILKQGQIEKTRHELYNKLNNMK